MRQALPSISGSPAGSASIRISRLRRIGRVGNPDRDREAVRAQPAEHAGLVLAEEAPSGRPRPAAAGGARRAPSGGSSMWPERTSSRWASWIVGLLRQVAVRPDEDPLGADLDVEPRVVPVEQAAQRLRAGASSSSPAASRRTRAGSARAFASRSSSSTVAVPWTSTLIALSSPDPVGSEKSRATLGWARASSAFFGIAEAGGHVDRRPARLVVGGDRPGDRLLPRVDGRELAGDEALEGVADLLRQGAGHRLDSYGRGQGSSSGRTIRCSSPSPTTSGSTGLTSRRRAASSASAAFANPTRDSRCLMVGKTRGSSPAWWLSRAACGSNQPASTVSEPSGCGGEWAGARAR